mmetsp:Transcript_2997/g.6989  ORF Transcript_2997/g.6989 Transcript_2997/m.6989 type:complete len:465 (-) Transcript_2997:144-1538(-)
MTTARVGGHYGHAIVIHLLVGGLTLLKSVVAEALCDGLNLLAMRVGSAEFLFARGLLPPFNLRLLLLRPLHALLPVHLLALVGVPLVTAKVLIGAAVNEPPPPPAELAAVHGLLTALQVAIRLLSLHAAQTPVAEELQAPEIPDVVPNPNLTCPTRYGHGSFHAVFMHEVDGPLRPLLLFAGPRFGAGAVRALCGEERTALPARVWAAVALVHAECAFLAEAVAQAVRLFVFALVSAGQMRRLLFLRFFAFAVPTTGAKLPKLRRFTTPGLLSLMADRAFGAEAIALVVCEDFAGVGGLAALRPALAMVACGLEVRLVAVGTRRGAIRILQPANGPTWALAVPIPVRTTALDAPSCCRACGRHAQALLAVLGKVSLTLAFCLIPMGAALLAVEIAQGIGRTFAVTVLIHLFASIFRRAVISRWGNKAPVHVAQLEHVLIGKVAGLTHPLVQATLLGAPFFLRLL